MGLGGKADADARPRPNRVLILEHDAKLVADANAIHRQPMLAGALQRTPPGKPVLVLVAGRSAPEGATMGHAGAQVFRAMHGMVAGVRAA